MKLSKDVLTGSVVIVLSLLLFAATLGVKDFAATGVGAAFLPRIAAGLFAFLGVVMVAGGLYKPSGNAKPARPEPPQSDKSATVPFGGAASVLLSFGLMCAYVGLLDSLGFILTSIVYIFAQTLILTKGAPRHYLLFGVLALFTSVGAYYLFVRVFQVMIPAGILG